MKHKETILVFFCLICLLPLYSQNSNLAVKIDRLLAPLLAKGANISVDIRDISHDSTLYVQNPNSYMTPASVQKLFTTSVCLLALGKDYQYKTPVMYSGKMKRHKIKGDLVICGSGDPSMSNRYYKGDAVSIFENWADSLLVRKIHKIKGDIIILDTLFQVKPWGSGWNWDDLAYDYAAEITSFIFNENRGFMTIMGTEDGSPPEIIVQSENNDIPIRNDVVTSSKITRNSIQITPMLNRAGLVITGSIKPNNKDEEYFAIPNPEMTSGNILRSILIRKGIKCSGKVCVVHSLNELKQKHLKVIFEHSSPDLAKIIRLTNKQSINLSAEALLLKLGRTEQKSIYLLKKVVQEMNINADSLYIVDGSGLSRYNLCTASQCSDLLAYMYDKQEFIPFIVSLSIAGKDGSLSNRMKDSPATGRVFAKTGSMRFVRNISGYALNQNDTLIAFTILMNDYPNDKEMIAIQDAICSLIADSSF
jgi:serine-type D-Ala-D-Ala carboxypeptidase/endopeptidase (penicillin-binding protein 4)